MTDKRLLYRVILKLMAAIGIITLLFVFLNATFNSRDDVEDVAPIISSEVVFLTLKNIDAGKVTTIFWENKRVGVIKRSDELQANMIKQASQPPANNTWDIETHAWRSVNPSYFIYYDTGDSGYCPLFFEGQSFKDTCSGSHYDLTGRQSGGTKMLAIPPHYFVNADELVVGRWEAD